MSRTGGEVSPEEMPWIVRHLTGPWHWHHPRLFVGVELLVAMWLVALGAILSAQGYWESALCFLFVVFMLAFLWVFARALGSVDARIARERPLSARAGRNARRSPCRSGRNRRSSRGCCPVCRTR